jgi:hypothetical protein
LPLRKLARKRVRKPPAPKARPVRKKRASPVEDKFLAQIIEAELPAPVRELAFDEPGSDRKKRRWRFDMAWPDLRVAAEVEGGVWGGGRPCRVCKQRKAGRHNSPAGFEKDCEKYGHGVAQGWQILRVTSKMVKNGMGIRLLKELFKFRETA